MNASVHRLQSDLERFTRFLEEGESLSLTSEERESLHAAALELRKRLENLETRSLVVGILGGTGVGKSSLMNGLAGSPIASTSHRRPHTDRVLVYRHESTPLPEAVRSCPVPWVDVPHQADAVRQIVLCDLPDFDSLMGEHRERVLGFLEHLDLVIWVTSPEKYADALFYRFMEGVSKARENFCFVLNKCDHFFAGGSGEDGYRNLDAVTRRFLAHLREHGFSEPLLFVVSAREVLENPGNLSPWNQFPAFRRFAFQQRDAKEIRGIKEANLDVEVDVLLQALDRESMTLELFETALSELEREFKDLHSEWMQAGRRILEPWIEGELKEKVMLSLQDPEHLRGAARWVYVLSLQWEQRFRNGGVPRREPGFFAPPETVVRSLEQHGQWLQNRITHGLLRRNVPPAVRSRIQEMLQLPESPGSLAEELSERTSLHLKGRPGPGLVWFRLRQTAASGMLLALLLVALGGETAWGTFLEQPSPASSARLVLAIVHAVFSGRGLAALGSYTLLLFFLGLRFSRRYKKILQRMAQKIIESLESDFIAFWDNRWNDVLSRIEDLKKEVQARKTSVAALRKPPQGPRTHAG